MKKINEQILNKQMEDFYRRIKLQAHFGIQTNKENLDRNDILIKSTKVTNNTSQSSHKKQEEFSKKPTKQLKLSFKLNAIISTIKLKTCNTYIPKFA